MRLLGYILAFSSFVTIIATGVQLYTDFKRDVNLIETRLQELEISYLSSIRASLWNMDIDQLNIQLEGILRFPDVKWVELCETDQNIQKPLKLAIGEPSTTKARISHAYPIIYESTDGEQRSLGELTVEVSLENIYERLYDRATVILLSQGIKTFIVSLFILYLVHTLITRHLEYIAEHLRNLKLSEPIQTLTLTRRQQSRPDELDQVVKAHNIMSASLRKAYQDLTNANRALENDIIKRKKAEEEVKRLNANLENRVAQRTSELEAANNELSSFCYSVSHDLRAPLRRIEGFRKILYEKYKEILDENGLHYLTRIGAGAIEMSEMIDSFLRLSRSTSTTLTLDKVNLSALAQKTIDKLLEQEPDRQLELDIQTELYAEADRRLIDILLTNLLENAWKYTKHEKLAHIKFGAVSNQKGVNVYFVKDNGAGFDMNLAEHLFKPFTRLHKSDRFDGIGIGLTTVQRIVARHGGRVWFEAEKDKGATFYFTLWELGNA